MRRTDPRRRLARTIAKEHEGSTLGAFLDRRGNEWVATPSFLVRAEMVPPGPLPLAEGNAATAARRMLRKLSADPSSLMSQEPGLFFDPSRWDPPQLVAMRCLDGPNQHGHVWFSERWGERDLRSRGGCVAVIGLRVACRRNPAAGAAAPQP